MTDKKLETTQPSADPHYICNKGCGYISDDEDAKCRTLGCYRYRNPLTECTCTDGKHKKILTFHNPNGIVPPKKRD